MRISSQGPVAWLVALAATLSIGAAPASGAVPRLSPSPGTDTHLFGVSAVTTDDVWAVGWYRSGGRASTLALQWDGKAWTQVPTPNPGRANGSYLYAVTTLSSMSAWAVGSVGRPAGLLSSLILSWNGTTWSRVPSPNPGGPDGSTELFAVSASSPTDAWAVGTYSNDSEGGTLTLHWDGVEWTRILNPPSRVNASLRGVATLSPTDAWAVGRRADVSGGTLVLHWDGESWSRSRAPHPYGTILWAVDAGSSTDVWAGGGYSSPTAIPHALTLHNDGSGWKRSRGWRRGYLPSNVNGLDVIGSNDVWGVGWKAPTDLSPLALHWNGDVWRSEPVRDPVGSCRLESVGHLASDDVWAVGFCEIDDDVRTLVLHWGGEEWSRV